MPKRKSTNYKDLQKELCFGGFLEIIFRLLSMGIKSLGELSAEIPHHAYMVRA